MMKILSFSEFNPDSIRENEGENRRIQSAVSAILADVRKEGDEAVLRYTKEFDGAELSGLLVSQGEIQEALQTVEPEFLSILREAADNIRAFHKKQLGNGFSYAKEGGILLGQRLLPLDRVGVYIPGGSAAYPSSVLMNIIPAVIAGCREIIMMTPPGKNGRILPGVLAAASIAGASAIYKAGGAQAVAALAYGTESVPRVDKITGPGNAYVAEAKRQVFGSCGIDMIAGPSEVLIIADETANPAFLAADLLSQAEHDKKAQAILLTNSPLLAEAVNLEIARQLALLPRAEIAAASLRERGFIVLVSENFPRAALELSNKIAPEHLEICLPNAIEYLGEIRHAGSVFLGSYCPEAVGDYFAGPNHTLPTGGSARFSSPLSVEDFMKRMQFSCYSREGLRKDYKKIARFAREEGLHAHARSLLIRFEEGES